MEPTKLTAMLLKNTTPEPNTGCWLWLLKIDRWGYGQAKFGGRTWKAHRLTYETLRGPVPAGMELDHRCTVECCVNPAHLEPVTHPVNMRRAEPSTRQKCPRGHPYSGGNVKWRKRLRSGSIRLERVCRACRHEAQRERRSRGSR